MPIDLDKAVGAPLPATEYSWTEDTLMLYALGAGVGIGQDQTSLAGPPIHVRERPPRAPDVRRRPELPDVDGAHERTGAELQPDDAAARRAVPRGSRDPDPDERHHQDRREDHGHLRQGQRRARRDRGDHDASTAAYPVFKNEFGIFLRGEGGFGGDAGPAATNEAPKRAPDAVVETPTLDASSAALSSLRRQEPAPRRPRLRQDGRLRQADPARPLHLRERRPRRHPGLRRRRSDPLPLDSRALRASGDAGRDDRHRDVEGVADRHRRPGEGEGARSGRDLERSRHARPEESAACTTRAGSELLGAVPGGATGSAACRRQRPPTRRRAARSRRDRRRDHRRRNRAGRAERARTASASPSSATEPASRSASSIATSAARPAS